MRVNVDLEACQGHGVCHMSAPDVFDLAEEDGHSIVRTDPESLLRRPAPAVTAPMLSSDGGNLAAVFATLRFIREETVDLDEAIDEAFPGARLEVPEPTDFATFAMVSHDAIPAPICTEGPSRPIEWPDPMHRMPVMNLPSGTIGLMTPDRR